MAKNGEPRSPERIKYDWKMQLINGEAFVAHMVRNGSALLRKRMGERFSELEGLAEPTTEKELEKCLLAWQGLFSIVSGAVHIEHMGKHAARAADVRELVERVCGLVLPASQAQTKSLKDAIDQARLDIQALAFDGLAQRRMNRR